MPSGADEPRGPRFGRGPRAAVVVKRPPGPPLRPGEELEEVTWIRLRRRMGLDGR